MNEIKSDKLTLLNVDRSMAGLYVCNAFNGIPSQVSKRIPLYVKCKSPGEQRARTPIR